MREWGSTQMQARTEMQASLKRTDGTEREAGQGTGPSAKLGRARDRARSWAGLQLLGQAHLRDKVQGMEVSKT